MLDLSPYDNEGVFYQSRYRQVGKEIEPAYVISPTSIQCQTQSCNGRSFHTNTRDHDTPRVTLIKGSKIYEEVHVLSGKCPQCKQFTMQTMKPLHQLIQMVMMMVAPWSI